MLSTTGHLAQIADLERQNRELREELALARGKLLVYSHFHGNIYGEFGEQFIAQCPEVARVFGNKGHDGMTAAGKYEVKFARLQLPTETNKASKAGRWQWGKIRGMQGRKDYDYLILVGYREENAITVKDHSSNSNFDFFVVPREDVEYILSLTPGRREIGLNPVPQQKGRKSNTDLLHHYRYSQADLVNWLSQPTAPSSPRPELRRPPQVRTFLADRLLATSQQIAPTVPNPSCETTRDQPG